MGLFDAIRDGVTGVTGAPTPDLSEWRATHGLADHGENNIIGYGFTLKPGWPDTRRNVTAGLLPGGEHGVLFHDVGKRARRETAHGHTNAPIQLTRIGVFAGEGIAGLQRFRASVADEAPPGWSNIPSEEIGLARRRLYCSPNVEIETLKRAMAGGLAERFEALDPEVTPNFRFGTLIFAKDGLLQAAEIESLCKEICACAAIVRAAAAPGSREALQTLLPAPFFINEADAAGRPLAPQPPYPQTADIEGVGLDQVLTMEWMTFATALGTGFPEAGLAAEDTLSFYRAFPRFPVPGQAVLVANGRLPGTEIAGRTVILADNYPDTSNLGFDAFVVDAGGAADTPGPHVDTGYLRCAVRDGWACIWRERQEVQRPTQLDPSAYAQFAGDAARLIEARGWGG